MSAPPNRPELASAPNAAPSRDAARQPRSLADRLRLSVILVLVPALVVCIPTVVVSYIFGQRPAPKAQPHTEALKISLEQSASSLLPTPAPLAPDTITVTVRADHLAARLEKISQQAREFGGSASEGLSTTTEKRLSVELPAGRAEAFRQAVSSNAAAGTPPPSPAVNSPAAGRDYVEVVVRAAAGDE